MVQSRAELGERSAWVWTLKAQMLHGAGGPHGHLNEEEGTNRRFLGTFFFAFCCCWFSFDLVCFFWGFLFLFICPPPRQLDNSEKDADLGVCVKGEKQADKELASASGRKGVDTLGNMREEM